MRRMMVNVGRIVIVLAALLGLALPAQAATSEAGTASSTASEAGTIVFQTSSGGAIYAVQADGTGLRYLTTGMDPAISPDGTMVAFTRWESSSNGAWGSLWVINIDGTGERAILQNLHQPKSPTWSADGTQIVINMQQGGTVAAERQCVTAGSGPRGIPRDAYDITEENGQICYTVPADPLWGLRVVDVATGEYTDLARDAHSFAPTWNPAQSWQVVYAGDSGLVSLDLNRNANWALTGDANMRAPVYSPDGSRIATTYWQHDHWEVHVMNADGSGDVKLTKTSLVQVVEQELSGETAHSANNVAPAWSPDGTQIAFLTDRSGQWEIWVMNADGSNQHVLLSADDLAGQGITLQYYGVDERVISWG